MKQKRTYRTLTVILVVLIAMSFVAPAVSAAPLATGGLWTRVETPMWELPSEAFPSLDSEGKQIMLNAGTPVSVSEVQGAWVQEVVSGYWLRMSDLTSIKPESVAKMELEEELKEVQLTGTNLWDFFKFLEKYFPAAVSAPVAVAPAIAPTVPVTTTASAAFAPIAQAGGRPIPWVAANGQACSWGIPSGTVLAAGGGDYIFTNCTSINLGPGGKLAATWVYDPVDYQFLIGNEGAVGVAWWGPLAGSRAEVSYNGSPVCTGRSFEIVSGVTISVTFENDVGSTNAVWAQGEWNTSVGKNFPPECRASSVAPAAPPVTTPSAPIAAPPADAAMQTTAKAVFGPIIFEGKEGTFQIQHLGDFSFHVTGWSVETVAPNFVCTWADWSTGATVPPSPWTGDYKVTCTTAQ